MKDLHLEMQLCLDFEKSPFCAKCEKPAFLLGYMQHSVHRAFFGLFAAAETRLTVYAHFLRITPRRED
jgi:hypothetical protein